jgi:dTDP-4-dehydrorhamnose reductase
MRILILGGDGMLGHQLYKHLSLTHDVSVTLHQERRLYAKYGIFDDKNTYGGIDVRNTESLGGVLRDCEPDVVINAVGIIKQRKSAKESIPSIEINALFPHRLALLCESINARMIHLSTDCVFAGTKGNYQENDPSDAEDLYGKSKYLGEVNENHCLTLRTSMIGEELSRKNSLLEWFLAQEESIRGFKKAIFTGFTTQELARIIETLIVNYPYASGLYHVSSEPISKYDLLNMVKDGLKLPIEILPDTSFFCDRSLDSSKFRKEFNYQPPTWDEMIDELCEDILLNPYDTMGTET